MLRIKRVSEVIGKHVYTAEGDYFGQIEEANLVDNKIEGWRIKVSSSGAGMFGGARGVVIPHQFVRAMGDICLINKVSVPSKEQPMDLAMPSGDDQELV